MKMLCKCKVSNIFCTKFVDYRSLIKRNSALFINGVKAVETFTYVTPHIDFLDKIQQKHELQKELERRMTNYKLEKVENLWSVYQDLKQQKVELDNKRNEISKEIGNLIKNNGEDKEIDKLKLQITLIKDNIRKLKHPLWSSEEAAMVEALNLPNSLHPLTPDASKTIHSHLTKPTGQKDHMKIGKDLNILNFKKNENYYLKGDAAILELGAKFYFNKLLRDRNFVQFSNPDFVKSVVVEGCGLNHTDPDATFILHHNDATKVSVDNRLHLTGGGSLCSFLAYHTKNVLFPKLFPLKYFSMGRQYIPSKSEVDSLFHVTQSSVVQLFGGAKTSTDLDTMLEELIEILISAYTDIGYHFQLKLVSANKLSMWESARVAVEMYSPSLNRYVEVANVSVSGDYISKRLMFTYVDEKQTKFPLLLSGTILNVPKFLACILEQDADFSVPEMFKVQNWEM